MTPQKTTFGYILVKFNPLKSINRGKKPNSRVQSPTRSFRSGCYGDGLQPVVISPPRLNAQLYGSFKSITLKEITRVDDDMRFQAVFVDLGPEWRRQVTEARAQPETEWRQTFYVIQDQDLKKTTWSISSSNTVQRFQTWLRGTFPNPIYIRMLKK